MARIRSIKPEFWSSEQVMECSPNARLLFIGIWNFADDHGRHPHNPRQLKALVFPSDDFSADDVRRMIDELEANGLIECYDADGKRFFQVTGWRHQKIDRPQPARFPGKDAGIRRAIVERSPTEGNTEGRRKGSSLRSEPSAPSVQDAVRGAARPDRIEVDPVPSGQAERVPSRVEVEPMPPGMPRSGAEHAALEVRLREAAGLEASTAPAIFDLSPILGLIREGFSLEADILPVLRGKRAKPGRSWRFYVDAIREARTANAAPPARANGNHAEAPSRRADFTTELADPTIREKALRSWWVDGWWSEKQWGPPPRHPLCALPADVIAAWGEANGWDAPQVPAGAGR